MTDPTPLEPTPDPAQASAPAPEPSPATAPQPAARPTFEQRMDSFGREMGAAGERIGREAEAAGQRLAQDPSVQRTADTLARIWGVVILAAGLWFLADVTIGMDMPSVAWGDLWPIGLILIGLFVVVRGMARTRRA
jgi:hypothetical protein